MLMTAPPTEQASHAPATADFAPDSSTMTIARIVREGFARTPKQLPPWLFYDEAGSLLFEQITSLPEYYPTRLERALFAEHADEMIASAAEGHPLRLVELGAGSADKTRTLLSAALAQQGAVEYVPVDVSATALEMACRRIEAELPQVQTTPVVEDYTVTWSVPEPSENGRQLLLWIGSSIGNFEPEAAIEVLRRINRTMRPGDALLLGADLAPAQSAEMPAGGKCVEELIAAYDDAAGVTAAFNCNVLTRLNRELGADFDVEMFTHKAVWNRDESRIEMHLESNAAQSVWIDELGTGVRFAAGERIHTENSYKYTPEQIAGLLAVAGFPVEQHWLAGNGTGSEGAWFAVLLGRKI
jgi:L-histidine N-alpha-methyltransferase